MSKNSNSIYQRTKSFLEKAKNVHNGKYDYSLVEYVHSEIKVAIVCPEHGKFLQPPKKHAFGQGCPKCRTSKAKDTVLVKQKSLFLTAAIKKHNNRYDYTKTEYVNATLPVTIICRIHGEFTQKPNNHLSGKGCSKCGGSHKLTTAEFIKKSHLIHNNVYNYSNVEYFNNRTKVAIVCPKHGTFFQTPTKHLIGRGCFKCCLSGFSKIAITWLEMISKKDGIFIQHALNDGEYSIPCTRLKADGYCRETNTIYEFYGDEFHGNPVTKKSSDFSKICKKTYKELYKNTLKREVIIRSLGYNLVTIWEYDFKNLI